MYFCVIPDYVNQAVYVLLVYFEFSFVNFYRISKM